MVPVDVSPDGFEADETRELAPRAVLPDRTRAQAIRVLVAMTLGHTPEEIARFRADGWPARVEELGSSPMHQDEMSRHLDAVVDVLGERPLRAAAA